MHTRSRHRDRIRRVPARRVDVVSSRVVGVDGAVEGVVLCTVQRVLVEAFLCHHPVRVVQVVAAAEEELDVALRAIMADSRHRAVDVYLT